MYNICKGRLGSRLGEGKGLYRVRLHFNERFREIFLEVADLAPVCVCVCVCVCVSRQQLRPYAASAMA